MSSPSRRVLQGGHKGGAVVVLPSQHRLDEEDIHGVVVVLPAQHRLDGQDIHVAVVVLPLSLFTAWIYDSAACSQLHHDYCCQKRRKTTLFGEDNHGTVVVLPS